MHSKKERELPYKTELRQREARLKQELKSMEAQQAHLTPLTDRWFEQREKINRKRIKLETVRSRQAHLGRERSGIQSRSVTNIPYIR